MGVCIMPRLMRLIYLDECRLAYLGEKVFKIWTGEMIEDVGHYG